MIRTGIVAIGRNEGERLRQCLESVDPKSRPVVYVDSGSTDGSVELARSFGAEVVALDMTVPFTAARARNEGFARLKQLSPGLVYVQFVDGDCEVVGGWLARAEHELDCDDAVGAVCGRRRERYPEKSTYNRLCDIEWDTPVGDNRSCGGDAMMRRIAVDAVRGYNPAVIAGEDDEICVRLRRAGWKIRRVAAEMTIHDAAIYRFSQWWKRAVRCGYAYSLGFSMHGAAPENHFRRERLRVVVWGFLIPMCLLLLAIPTFGISLSGFLIYPLQMYRIARYARGRHGLSAKDARAWGVSCKVAKFPEFVGVCRFWFNRLTRREAKIIEYK